MGPFCPNLSKNGFPWKKRLSVFKYFNYVSLRKKKRSQAEGLTNTQTDTNTDTDRQTQGQTDRKRRFYRTIRRTGVQLFRETIESAYKASQEKNPKAFSG